MFLKKLFTKKRKNNYIISTYPVMHILRDWCAACGISNKNIMFTAKEGKITIYTDRPGVLIGKGGALIEEYKKKFNDAYTNCELEILEVHRLWSQEEEDGYLDSLMTRWGF